MTSRLAPLRRLLPVLALLAGLTATPAARAEVTTERVSYDHLGELYYGWMVQDTTLPTPRPAVILFHEWWGLEEFALQEARELAELGYVVFAADLYGIAPSGDNVVAETPEEAARLSGRLFRDRQWMRGLATAAYLATAAQDSVDATRIAAMGFGFGATVALELARAGTNIDATICLHGSLHNPTPESAERIRGEVLVLQGTEDPMVPREDLEAFEAEMDAADKPYQLVLISGAEHAFSNRRADFWEIPGASYDRRADEIATDQVARFLERTLGGPTQGRERRVDE